MRTNGLLERDRERAELRSVIEAACRRDGAAALVSGHGGIGKTRLLGEAAPIATQPGAEVLRAHGGEWSATSRTASYASCSRRRPPHSNANKRSSDPA